MDAGVFSPTPRAAGRLRGSMTQIVFSWIDYPARPRSDSTRTAFGGCDEMASTLKLAESKSRKGGFQRKARHAAPARFISSVLSGATMGASTDPCWLGIVLGVFGAVAEMLEGTVMRASVVEVLGEGTTLWLRWKTGVQSAAELLLRDGQFGCFREVEWARAASVLHVVNNARSASVRCPASWHASQ